MCLLQKECCANCTYYRKCPESLSLCKACIYFEECAFPSHHETLLAEKK